MNINNFTPGDIITRISPSIGVHDRSYIGDKLLFIGIANGCVQFQELNNPFINQSEIRKVELDWFSDGWDHYVDPQTLLDELNNNASFGRGLRKLKK